MPEAGRRRKIRVGRQVVQGRRFEVFVFFAVLRSSSLSSVWGEFIIEYFWRQRLLVFEPTFFYVLSFCEFVL